MGFDLGLCPDSKLQNRAAANDYFLLSLMNPFLHFFLLLESFLCFSFLPLTIYHWCLLPSVCSCDRCLMPDWKSNFLLGYNNVMLCQKKYKKHGVLSEHQLKTQCLTVCLSHLLSLRRPARLFVSPCVSLARVMIQGLLWSQQSDTEPAREHGGWGMIEGGGGRG